MDGWQVIGLIRLVGLFVLDDQALARWRLRSCGHIAVIRVVRVVVVTRLWRVVRAIRVVGLCGLDDWILGLLGYTG